ncbi:MAG: ribosome small subunit-dependent GTPase A [Bacilli bacterium]|nr:ribosome small subunit-dependent GTPase A [Bacilli bacterium]
MEGKIIKLISNDYSVLSENKQYVCKSRGKFRNMNITPLVGDNVIFDEQNKYILEIKPRKNSLIRPPVSNIDQAFIIASVKDPDFSTHLLDKLLVIIEFNNIKPIICFTKLDLLKQDELENINNYINYYKKIGYTVFENTELDKIKETFKNKISVFTGQSGAGKSTLLNKLDINLNIKTDQISYALGRGKHTTRHVELIPIFDGLVADTPGFSSLDFYDMKLSDIRDNFIEFNEYRELCKYKDCMHHKETECAIKNKVNENIIIKSRYENYISFIEKK